MRCHRSSVTLTDEWGIDLKQHGMAFWYLSPNPSRLESGQTQRSVADAVGVARSVVARLWNRFQETGNVRRRPGAGRPRATISTDDRYIQLTARRNRTENATQLQIHLLLATG
ncbi:hypothetical protein TNCV_2415162 [Trichonephila clavipes]|nr:hypothetical protein TNCV_2415162 [Trichonephila clavipes]